MSTGIQLVLIRHAEAEGSGSGGDAERQLTERGLRQALELGEWLKGQDLLPNVVICSPAARTRQTWAGVVEATGSGVLIDFEPRIYEAGVEDLMAVLREAHVPEGPVRVAVVGHAPGIPQLAYDLDDGSSALRDELVRGFSPSSVAVVDLGVTLPEVAPETGRLSSVRIA